ncbi:Uncharacterized protein HZ326_17700 [Fusarium oxysporum f. sp. albedinis]|nr:Uncharacterized protein HZ326_17700 [Fusarium oxysporum f. sp. albedinis]
MRLHISQASTQCFGDMASKGGTQPHPSVHSAWENVHSRCFLSFEGKGTWLIILSHAAAISCLGLEHVVSDVSLRQIQLENSITY